MTECAVHASRRGSACATAFVMDSDFIGIGGRCEIRTHERLAPLPVFKTGALNRSANLPACYGKCLSALEIVSPDPHITSCNGAPNTVSLYWAGCESRNSSRSDRV